ncbi:MAG: amino acid adenylation domain-containing protein [Cyanobacteria bacterium P01_H01_bin.21]
MQSAQISGFRLSPQQKRVWFLHQGSSSSSYCVQGAFLIAGHLDVDALKNTLQAIVNRHEILRTTFQCLSGMTTPLQVIAEDYEVLINEHSLVDLPLHTQEAEAEVLFHQLKQHPFELAETPPFIINLLKLSPHKHLLFLRLSALIADDLTLSQILHEINTLYGADLHAQNYDQEIMQYADVAEWQHELLEQEEYSPGKEYWQTSNTSYSEFSNINFLSTNKDPKIPKAYLPSIKPISISLASDLVERIKVLANSLKVSISDILLSCWQVLLWRIATQEAPTVKIVSSGRTHEELKATLGALSKCLPISCSLDHNLSFQEILKQVSESVNHAYEWQDYFAWDASISDGCQFHFEFNEWPESVYQKGVSFSLYKRYVHREQCKINLVCLQKDNALEIELYYDDSLYQAESIKNLSDWFLSLLEDAVHDSKRTIGQLKLLSKHQQQKILVDFNQTQTEYPRSQCIHRVFETQVNQTPDNIAVVFEDQQLTYGELNAKANQLAHYLQTLGVTREQVVGIYLERSQKFIISLLAILKAGGAYLPLDPALPKENLIFRLQDAQVSVVLSQTTLVDTLSNCGVHPIDIDSHWEKISQENTTNLSTATEADNLAYVIFTSGSTGKPKGVAVEHRHLFNYSRAIAEKLNLSVCKSFALVSTFSADLGNTAIFPALLNGACLHIISAQIATNPEALADYFERYPIDCLKIVPSHLAALLTASRPEQILPDQCLVLGGEACRWELIEQIYTYAPSCHIFNHYGPTETTVGVLTYPINQAALTNKPPHQETVPIGSPIANTHVYLLNAALQPVPIGVPGEIYIGGAGTARGYLNRPQLTAERFLSNPFAQLSEPALSASTLYKTGDLGRYQPDGTIEFLGRIDNQVKIRGYRIELGEIESAISKHSMVQAAAVLACASQSNNKRLVAYVVPQKQSNLTVDKLRDALKKSLPDYMVPAAFVLLKELPLTANGKLDRQALLAYESPSERENSFVAPSTKAEKALVQIWGKTLGVEKIGIHDNFFELGGDSILSIQIVARANQAGLKLTPKQIFENQTIAKLASVANTQQAIQAEQGIVLGDVPLTPIQHWFFEQKLSEAHHWNQCVLLKVQQPLELEQLELVIWALLEHHDVLRLRYVREETGWQQHIAKLDEMSVLTQVDLSAVAEDKQSKAISKAAAELQTTLNLESGPLLRVAYFDLGKNKPGRLLLIIHHLAVDGVSWRILLEDLQIAQQQLSRGDTLQLPSKTTSFQYWATQLFNYGQSETLQKELDYWLDQSSQSKLPVDFPGGDNTVAKADIVSVALNQAETQALLQEVPAAYKTQINDVLVTAVMQVFAQWTGEYSLLIDLEGHGREDMFEDIDLSRTVGWFTTIFPVKLTLKRSDYPGDNIKAIKEQLRRIPNRGIGYGILRYLNTQTTRHWQQAEVRFNYLGQTDQVLQQSPLFAPAYESKGPRHSPKSIRRYPIDIHGIVADGQLTVGWTYSKELYRRTTIELLAKNFIEALRVLITHCQSPWDRT